MGCALRFARVAISTQTSGNRVGIQDTKKQHGDETYERGQVTHHSQQDRHTTRASTRETQTRTTLGHLRGKAEVTRATSQSYAEQGARLPQGVGA